jgi:hypothetical protein
MGQIVCVSKITEAMYKAAIEAGINKCLALAAKELNKPVGDFAVREVMPATDLGYTTEVWDNENQLTAVTWTKDIGHSLDNDEYLVILGIQNQTDDPQVVGVKFKVGSSGATTRDVQMFEQLYAEDIHKALFKEPIIYKGNEYVYIEYYAKTTVAAAGEKIGLIAYLIKPYGEDISAPLPW